MPFNKTHILNEFWFFMCIFSGSKGAVFQWRRRSCCRFNQRYDMFQMHLPSKCFQFVVIHTCVSRITHAIRVTESRKRKKKKLQLKTVAGNVSRIMELSTTPPPRSLHVRIISTQFLEMNNCHFPRVYGKFQWLLNMRKQAQWLRRQKNISSKKAMTNGWR